ncbi:MAG: enoyl-[acyl-carrier-protein] reductase FabL [Firmicutes bacterium]|nr:enoyl-[acyl-carrier-protein] reductase FabL [Bacillota bacterium]
MHPRFAGKVVVITGSSRGIGRRMAERFAQEGAAVVINYFRNGPAAREVAEEIEEIGGETLVVKANMADPEKIDALFEQVERRFGKIDVFIHNAASGRNRPLMELDQKGYRWTEDVNVQAYLLCVQHAVPLMGERGNILALSSFGSDHVLPYYASVGATKAAIEALTRYIAVELAPQINANVISAGAVVTGALEHFPEIEGTFARVEEKIPAGRMVTAEDVANVALFLCSPEAEMIRGQVIRVDGGLTLPLPW